jgi:hypothetical protein
MPGPTHQNMSLSEMLTLYISGVSVVVNTSDVCLVTQRAALLECNVNVPQRFSNCCLYAYQLCINDDIPSDAIMLLLYVLLFCEQNCANAFISSLNV